MPKKLQENSVWAKYDIDQDGTVSDEELERATQMIRTRSPRRKARFPAPNCLGCYVFNGFVFVATP